MNRTFFIWISLIIGMLACKNQPEHYMLPNITGKAGELVVVIKENDWRSNLGDTIRRILMRPQPVLPQYEPLFDMIQISPDKFSNMFKTHRNILMIDQSNEYNKTGISYKKDMWAKYQAIIKVTGATGNAIARMISTKSEVIETFYLNAEMNRNIMHYKNNQKVELTNKLVQDHHVSLIIPKGYTLDMDTGNFVWISHETPRISQGIFIYYYDYKDTNTFERDYLIKKRNQFTKKYVAGPYPGSYMGTDTANTYLYSEYMKDEEYFAEVRGLWTTENKGFMGGPFISVNTVDEKRNRVVTVEGYVKALGQDKKNYLRQLESILQTLEIK